MGQGWFNPAGSKPALLHPLSLPGGTRETHCSCCGGTSEEHPAVLCWALWYPAAEAPWHLPLLPHSAALGDDVCRDEPQGKPPFWDCSRDTTGAESVLLFVLCVSSSFPELASVAAEESEGQTSSPAASSFSRAALGQTRGKGRVVPSRSQHNSQQAGCCCILYHLPCPQSLKGVEENLLLTQHVKEEFLETYPLHPFSSVLQVLWFQQGFPARFPAFVGAK